MILCLPRFHRQPLVIGNGSQCNVEPNWTASVKLLVCVLAVNSVPSCISCLGDAAYREVQLTVTVQATWEDIKMLLSPLALNVRQGECNSSDN